MFGLLAPILILSGIGYLLVKSKLIQAGWEKASSELTTKLLIPCLLFLGMYEKGLPGDVSLSLLLAYFLPFLVHVGLMFLFFRKSEFRAQYSFTSSYSNTVLVGIPVIVQALTEAALQYAFPIIAFHSLIGFTLYYLMDGASGGFGELRKSVLRTLRNPLVFSLLLGLFVNTVGIELPILLTQPIDLLSQAALPCALLVLGASLAQFKFANQATSLLIVAVKLMLFPSLVLLVASYLFNLPNEARATLLILAACPVGINAFILAEHDQKAVSLVGAAILLSSLAAIISIPLWLSFAGFVSP